MRRRIRSIPYRVCANTRFSRHCSADKDDSRVTLWVVMACLRFHLGESFGVHAGASAKLLAVYLQGELQEVLLHVLSLARDFRKSSNASMRKRNKYLKISNKHTGKIDLSHR